MVLLDLLHIQRAGFFKFLRSGLNEELSQLNINIENTRLEVLPFTTFVDNESVADKPLTLTKPLVSKAAPTSQMATLNSDGVRHAPTSQFNGTWSLADNSSLKKQRISSLRSHVVNKKKFSPSIILSTESRPRAKDAHLYVYPTITSSSGTHEAAKSDSRNTCSSAFSVPKAKAKTQNFRLGSKTHRKILSTKKFIASNEGSYISSPYLNKGIGYLPHGEATVLNPSLFIAEGKEKSLVASPQVEKITDYVTKRSTNITKNPCFCLIAPKYTPREAILYQKSWSCKLVVKVLLTVQGLDPSVGGNKLNHTAALSTMPVVPRTSPQEYPSAPLLPQGGTHGVKKKMFNYPFGVRTGGHPQGENSVRAPVYVQGRCSGVTPKATRCKETEGTFGQMGTGARNKAESNYEQVRMGKKVLAEIKHSALLSKSNKTQELFLVLGELPLMTKRGHFIINGSPRVILSQLIRTPGIYFTERDNELQADCIPEQGPWLCISKNSRAPQEENKNGIKQIKSEDLPKNSNLVTNVSKTFGSAVTGKTNFCLSEGQREVNKPFDNKDYTQQLAKTASSSKEYPVPLAKKHSAGKQGNGVKNKNLSSYFCYTKQFSSMPFSLIYSNFRTFELHSQFTDQTLLLTKLKTLEKIRQLRELISTLLTFTWKKRTRKRLQKLYTKRCFTATQQFEKTKIIFRLKRKLILGSLGRKSFNEKLAISNCEKRTEYPVAILPKEENVGSEFSLGAKKVFGGTNVKHGIPLNIFNMRGNDGATRCNDRFTPCTPYGCKECKGRRGAKIPGNNKSETTLLSQDLALIIRFLDSYKIMPKDDIDDLNNQRVRTSSDQVQQQVRVGCVRFRKMFIKLVKESWGVSQTITDLLNGALREFFGSNPLSQFLDQTNSLAEITHKRRISKLGLGGIQRESATLKVRTIHSTYFGRICPIETPEGVNAGLVNSLTCLSRVNEQGQLVTPLSPLIEKQLQNQFFYYSNQNKEAVSTTDTALLKFQRLPNQFIYTKNESHFEQLEVHKVPLRVQSDLQTISLATALIPFLPYDDANRALMGSNMQRQAVPLILPERPRIRTGLESLVIGESGHSKESPTGGFISYVSAQFVIIICHALNKRALSS